MHGCCQHTINPRYEQARAFYRGELADVRGFLEKHSVRYVLWLPRDNNAPANKVQNREDGTNVQARFQVFSRLNTAMSASGFDWHEFYRADPFTVGVWTRRPANPGIAP